ncbi:MAG: helix-turn-helix transcriptional regulator, partial [Pseudoclavibacter sp.]
PFDSLQVLRQVDGLAMLVELHREGYSLRSAAALREVFPRVYRAGFSRELEVGRGLPPSISENAESVQPRFRETELYLNALAADGYRDGMTMELHDGRSHIGLAHVSSYRPDVYGRSARIIGKGISGWLSDIAIRACPPLAGAAYWCVHAGPGRGGERARSADRDCSSSLVAMQRSGRAPEGAVWKHIAQIALVIAECGVSPRAFYWQWEGRLFNVTVTNLPQRGEVLVEGLPADAPFGLSAQHLRVLGLLVAGMSDREIAVMLGIGVRTVNTHVGVAMQRLGVRNRAQAAVRAATSACFIPDVAGLALRAASGTHV